jgi:hypothetical protein
MTDIGERAHRLLAAASCALVLLLTSSCSGGGTAPSVVAGTIAVSPTGTGMAGITSFAFRAE